MGIENRANQVELRNRTSDRISLVDSEAIKEVAVLIIDGIERRQHRAGEVIYPYSLSSREVGGVLKLVEKKNVGLLPRIGEFTRIRLEEGVGTVISIREKTHRRRHRR